MPETHRLVIYCTNFPSKKNSKSIVFSKTLGRPFIHSSSAYQRWELNARKVVAVWKVGKNLTFPINRCSLSIVFYFPNFIRRDLTNASEGVLDVLVRCNVLSDDNWKVVCPLKLYANISKVTPRIELYFSNINSEPDTESYPSNE